MVTVIYHIYIAFCLGFFPNLKFVSLDNSEWMRNGDFSPTRIAAQSDAVNLVCGAKMQFNPENSLAVLSMANRFTF
jgi:hypothetical protein